MQVTAMEILGRDGGKFPFSRATREALSRYVTSMAPTGRRKWVEQQWDLTSDQARSVIEGTASAATLDMIWKHRRGGWAVLLPVMGAVIGHSFEDFISNEQERLSNERRAFEEREARLGEMARHLRSSLHLGGVVGAELGARARGRGRSQHR
ncbi:MAG TPA: hypothetical protein VIO94_15820 [Phenylobacterium sp.]